MYVIYHCVSSYHIIQAMVHRRVKHPEEEAILIVADFTEKKFADLKEITPYFFDDFIEIPYRQIGNEPDLVISRITEFMDAVLGDIIHHVKEVYVAAAHYSFSLYLMEKNIPFFYMEDGCGILSKPQVSYNIVLNYDKNQANIAQTYGMFDGNNRYVKGIICNEEAQSFKVPFNNICSFDVVKELICLPQEFTSKILEFFRVDRIQADLSDKVIVFTQQFANLGMNDFDEQIAIYQTAVDFFLKGKKLLIKSHPDDIMFYESLFPQAERMKGKFPAELIPIMADKMAEISFTVFSSSVLSIRSGFGTNIFCGYDYNKTYWKTGRYFHALKLAASIMECGQDIYTYGADNRTIDNLCQFSIAELKSLNVRHMQFLEMADQAVVIVDDVKFVSDDFVNKDQKLDFYFEETEVKFSDEQKSQDLIRSKRIYLKEEDIDIKRPVSILTFIENLGEDAIVIFINSMRDYCFYDAVHDEVWKNIVPICVKTERNRKEVYVDTRPYVLYVYVKSERIKEKLKNYSEKLILENSGISQIITPVTDDKLKIAILEGMLDATQKRLLYYIEKEKINDSRN